MKIDVDLSLALACLRARLTGQIRVSRGLRQPGPLSLSLFSEDANVLHYRLTLPPPGAADVTLRKLTVKIDDAEPTAIPVALDQAAVEDLAVAEGARVQVTLVDVDGSTNTESPPRTLDFTAADTLPVPQPGELHAELVKED